MLEIYLPIAQVNIDIFLLLFLSLAVGVLSGLFGVGGSTADAIGRRLLDLSAFGQIITVTHSPQVAALASSHFQVLKELGKNGEVSISIKELKKSDRVEELARMISGKVITNEAKAAADSLISNGYSKENFN